MRIRVIDLGLSIVASAAALVLSWPYWRDFEYWAESPLAWLIYFVVGYLLAVYVFYIFMGATRTLFEHDALDHAEQAAALARQARDGEGRP